MFSKKVNNTDPVEPIVPEQEFLGKTPAMLAQMNKLNKINDLPRSVLQDDYPEQRLKKK